MRTLAVLVGLVILLAAIKAASSLLVPLLLATTLAIAFQPINDWLARHGWRPGVAAAVTAVGVLSFVAASGWLLWIATMDLAESLQSYQHEMVALQLDAARWLRAHGLREAAASVAHADVARPAQRLMQSGLWEVGSFLQMLFLVLIITAFIQLESTSYRRKLVQVLGSQRPVRSGLSALKDVQRYLLVKVVLSLANGVLLGLWCWAWGVPSPLLWGVVAFVLNFIPVVGSLIAAIPPVALALIELGPGGAAGVAAGYGVVNLVVDNIGEPRILGRALGLSPLVVLLSMLVWGFVLGPVGALLSVPLTMACKIALERSEDLRWLAVLLGSGDDLEPTPTAPATTADLAPNYRAPH